MEPSSVKSLRQDLWSNVKIPNLAPADALNSPNWINITAEQDLTYSSLLGDTSTRESAPSSPYAHLVDAAFAHPAHHALTQVAPPAGERRTSLPHDLVRPVHRGGCGQTGLGLAQPEATISIQSEPRSFPRIPLYRLHLLSIVT
jgi:hypothetical protein